MLILRKTFGLFLFFAVAVLLATLIGKGTFRVETDEAGLVSRKIAQNQLRQTIVDLQSMGERRSWESQVKTSRYLQGRIKAMNLKPKVQTYAHAGETWDNIIATFPGNRDPDSRILAVAHYDSKNWVHGANCPGADDNAAGVAVLLELAKLLSRTPHRSTVQLVFFSGEEYGQRGSKEFAREAREREESIKGVINVDVIGYGDTMAIFSRQLFETLKSDFDLKRKAKILVKMAYNWTTSFFNGRHLFKVVARSEDAHLVPDDPAAQTLRRIKWIVGDACP